MRFTVSGLLPFGTTKTMNSSSLATSVLTPLPHALVESIFTYALVHPDHYGLARRTTTVPPELKTIALVSREWNEYASNFASANTLRALKLEDITLKTRRDVVELRRRLPLRRAFLRELECKDSNTNAFSRSTTKTSLSLEQWRAIFSHAPHLHSLNLKWFDRSGVTRLARLVQAVRMQCPQLQRLVMPTLPPTRIARVSESLADTHTLIDAALTSPAGSNSLREFHLGVPTIQSVRREDVATPYLMRICDVCPDLEAFDGYTGMLDQMDKLTCEEQWFITPATWERFCSTLTKLKTFDWVVAPFATTFFEIFGRYPKPQLEKLVFSTPMNWDWDQFRVSYGVPQGTTGYGASARNAHEALKACPNVRNVEVAIYLPGDGGEDDDDDTFGWDVYGGMHNREQQQVPDEPMMDQDIFGDQFCEAVAKSCKKLEKFTIWRVLQSSEVSRTIMAFTDRAMNALATLPLLHWVELKSVNITGDGLFSLAACFARDSEHVKLQREFVITVGDDKGTPTEKAFYDVVEGFLKKLIACEPGDLPCATRRVALRLHNGCFSRVDREWSEEYLVRVRELAASALAKHPSVRLRVLTRGYYRATATTSASCDEIVEFGFYTIDTEINEWWGWVNEPQDTRIDDLVLNRGPLAAQNRRATAVPQPRVVFHDDDDDEDEYDDEEDDDDYYDDDDDDEDLHYIL